MESLSLKCGMFMNETWTPAPIIRLKVNKNSRDLLSLSKLFNEKIERNIYIYISRRGKNKNLTALKSNSNTVWFNFQTYIIFSINLVSFKVTLRSSGTDILYGCHLLLDVCIIYFISCDCIMNSSLSYPIY